MSGADFVGTNLQKHRGYLRETEVMIATWEMPRLSEAELAEYFPNLKLLIYVAGSVQKFARSYLHRGVRIASAWGGDEHSGSGMDSERHHSCQ